MAHIDRETTMENRFENPKKSEVDGQKFEEHSLPDQIAMDNHLDGKDVGTGKKKKNLGVLLRQFSPPGTVS